jgi:hypothetical protein
MSTVLSDKVAKTRKPHHCWGCAKVYPKGIHMRRVSAVYEGSLCSAYFCEVCEEYKNRYFDYSGDNGYEYGAIYKNDSEGWEAILSEGRRIANEPL